MISTPLKMRIATFFRSASGADGAGWLATLPFSTSGIPQPGQTPGLSNVTPSLAQPHGEQTYSFATAASFIRKADVQPYARPGAAEDINKRMTSTVLCVFIRFL